MPLLPPFLQNFLDRKLHRKKTRIYLSDEKLVTRIRDIAHSQRREPEDLYEDIFHAGVKTIEAHDLYAEIWNSLSERQQQVTALFCLGYTNKQIGEQIGITVDTVHSHLKNVYKLFGLGRRDIRYALRDWDFEYWVETSPDAQDIRLHSGPRTHKDRTRFGRNEF